MSPVVSIFDGDTIQVGQNLILYRIGYSAGFVQERIHHRCLQGGQS